MFKKIINIFLLFINVIAAALLLFACLVPYISVAIMPSLSIFSLLVPFMVLTNLLFLAYWGICFKKFFSLSLITLIVAYFFIGSFFQFRAERPYPGSEGISVMSFNTRLFNKYNWSEDPTISNQIVSFVNKKEPSVVCFQEFDVSKKSAFNKYPYSYISAYDNSKQAVQAIFSKYPIVSKGIIPFPNSTNTAIYADINTGKRFIRIYNVHFQSLRIKPEVASLSSEKRERLYKRLKVSFTKQQEQAELIAAHKSESPYQVILCGDFNTNQFSSVYHQVKGDFNDSFTQAGSGYGKTFVFKYFPMRIDFILSDPTFKILYHKNYAVTLSDHYPVMAVFNLE